MSITKLPTGACVATRSRLWCVRERHADGRPVHRHFGRKDEAENFVIRVRAERIGGEVIRQPERRTLEEYAEEWRIAQSWKDPEAARYSLKRAYPIIGKKPLSAVDGLSLQALQRSLFEHPYKRTTVEQTMHFVKAALRQAHADGLLSRDPTALVRLPRRDSLDKSGKVTPDQVPTTAEALAIIAGSPLRYRAGVALGLGCGLRVGEVLGLTPSRMSLGTGQITIDRQFQRGRLDSPKTWRGVRTIEPPDLVLTELRRALRPGMAPDMPLFEGARGGILRRDDFYQRAWRPALLAAGLPADRYKFHAARHYAVSSMLGRGVSVVEVAAYVGDAPETIISTYAHFLRESKSVAKGALDLSLAELGEPARDRTATGE
jgi:integrase